MLEKKIKEKFDFYKEKRYCMELKEAVMNKKDSLNSSPKNGEPRLSVWIIFKWKFDKALAKFTLILNLRRISAYHDRDKGEIKL